MPGRGGRRDGAADRRAARRPGARAGGRARGGQRWTGSRPRARTCRRSELRELRTLRLDGAVRGGPAGARRLGERRRAARRLRLRDRRRRALPRRLRALRRGRSRARCAARWPASSRSTTTRAARPSPTSRSSPCCRRSAATRSARCSASAPAPARGATAASCGRWRSTAPCAARPARSTSRRCTRGWREHIEKLNIEGASVLGDRLWLLQRGGGDGRGGRDRRRAVARAGDGLAAATTSASTRTSSPRCAPTTSARSTASPLTFSDATPVAQEVLVFTASAEGEGGAIRGSLVGTLDRGGQVRRLRTIDRRYKVEGVHATIDTGVMDFLFVCDQDDPDTPSPLLARGHARGRRARARRTEPAATPVRARRSRRRRAARPAHGSTPPETEAPPPPGPAATSPAGTATRPGHRTGPDRHGHEHLPAAHERTALRPRVQRLVVSREGVRPPRAQREQAVDQRELRGLGARRGARAQLVQQPPALLPVHGPPVVRVDEREGGQLVALVDVGHARAPSASARSGAAPPPPRGARSRRPPARSRPGTAGARTARGSSLHRGFVRLVRLDPVRRHLALAHRLLHVGDQPLRLERPGADERLEDRVLLDRVGRAARAQRRARRAPAPHRGRPLRRHPGQRAQAGPRVPGALRVVGGGDEQVARQARGALGVRRRGTGPRRSRSGSGRRRRR